MEELINYMFSEEIIRTTIPWFITTILLIGTTVKIIIEDYKRMKIVTWVLLLFVTIGFIGLIVTRLIAGTFNWWDILPIPVYFVLWFLNTKFNKNRFIGQADVDILNGSVALYFPIIFSLASVDYDYIEVNIVHISDALIGGLTFLLIGYGIALTIGIVRMIIQKIRKKDIQDLDKITEPGLRGAIKRMKIPVGIAFVPLYFFSFYYACFVNLV